MPGQGVTWEGPAQWHLSVRVFVLASMGMGEGVCLSAGAFVLGNLVQRAGDHSTHGFTQWGFHHSVMSRGRSRSEWSLLWEPPHGQHPLSAFPRLGPKAKGLSCLRGWSRTYHSECPSWVYFWLFPGVQAAQGSTGLLSWPCVQTPSGLTTHTQMSTSSGVCPPPSHVAHPCPLLLTLPGQSLWGGFGWVPASQL